ncbi:MAG: cupredoxin domain-containing protein [Chloroflexi bacterium]|nr:cupredoxin domain-containing protein [Chloroflexota bacterium]
MQRIDFSGSVLALLSGFLVSAGLTGFVLSAGGYELPTISGPRGIVAGSLAAPAVQTSAQAVAQTQAKAAPAAAVAPAEVKVTATDLKFSVPNIKAKVGQQVTITLDNKGVIEHDIAFPALKADKPAADLQVLAKPNQTATLTFTPSAKGKYDFICTIPGHKEAGMKGTLNVDD